MQTHTELAKVGTQTFLLRGDSANHQNTAAPSCYITYTSCLAFTEAGHFELKALRT